MEGDAEKVAFVKEQHPSGLLDFPSFSFEDGQQGPEILVSGSVATADFLQPPSPFAMVPTSPRNPSPIADSVFHTQQVTTKPVDMESFDMAFQQPSDDMSSFLGLDSESLNPLWADSLIDLFPLTNQS
jgi:hypothetical protein